MRTIRVMFTAVIALAAACVTGDAPGDATGEVLGVEAGWRHYGGDPGGSRYTAANEITRTNVGTLIEAWRYRTGDLGEAYPSSGRMAFEATPILVGGILYFSTPFGQVHAIDAQSGERVWKYDSAPPKDRHYSENTSRGVSYYAGGGQAGVEAHCAERIFFGTQDARLIALDARRGEPCTGFGDQGVVDLNAGMRAERPGNYLITSPPVVFENVVITGSAVGDNGHVRLAYGIVRGIDAMTGEVLWAWDPIPRDPSDPAHREWRADQVRETGAANAWSVLSLDRQRGIVYIPTGSASPDFYGGERLGSNRYANSVVALGARTGELVWARQLVHHDLWDYDIPAQPVLVDLNVDPKKEAEAIPALVQVTKMGMMFVLDRRTGEPIFPIEEKPVPASDVPGEEISPTQPFSSLPPLMDLGPVTEDDAFGLMLIDRWDCERQIRQYRSEGIYTPPSLQGTIFRPSYAGGANWGSVAFDPLRKLAVTNVVHFPAVVQLIPRARFPTSRDDVEHPDSEYTAQEGTPFGMRREILTSFLGVPCTEPPWGTLAAMDLRKGEIAWQVPLGTTEDFAPWPFDDIAGAAAVGGPMVTASGLVFIGAAMDDYLRAFDIETGGELWKGRLPAGGQATPMSYTIDGRQYVVIAAGGHGGAGTTKGDYVIAFSLP